MEILRGLVLCVHAFKFYENRTITSISAHQLWDHSMQTARGAQRLATFEKLPRNLCDEAFVCGLLHDIGKLVMAANADADYLEVMKRSKHGSLPADPLEKEIFGATHAQIGAYLLGLWGLPDAVVDAVDLHHNPRASGATGFTPLIAVHVTQCLQPPASRANRLDTAYLQELGLKEQIPVWRKQLSD